MARVGEDNIAGYTNSSNPWHDSKLTEKFVWKHKREDANREENEVDEAQQRAELMREIEKAKRRRLEREREKQLREEERSRIQREKDLQEAGDWEKKEEEFLLQQSKKRVEIRLREGRGKPLDVLYHVMTSPAPIFKLDKRAPYEILSGATLQDLNEFKDEILQFRQFDTDRRAFWDAMLAVCNEEIRCIQEKDTARQALHQSVRADIHKMLSEKTPEQLDTLHQQITQKLETGNAPDVEYWENLQHQCMVYKAKAIVKREYQKSSNHNNTTTNEAPTASTSTEIVASASVKQFFSPSSSYTFSSSEKAEETAAEQRRKLLEREAAKLREQTVVKAAEERMLSAEEMYRREADIPMEGGEEPFNNDIPLNLDRSVAYPWADKYVPKKPRFFNRLITGFEWNKYNQTHYDAENLPPKVVQGYKFNVFFPELVDPKKAPQYFIERSDSPDFVILHFRSGAPYEDVAFKIANKEWEYSHKKGFKCTFERGILHLWFTFKKYRYRR